MYSFLTNVTILSELPRVSKRYLPATAVMKRKAIAYRDGKLNVS